LLRIDDIALIKDSKAARSQRDLTALPFHLRAMFSDGIAGSRADVEAERLTYSLSP
jgi:hypothetical protein